MTIVMTVVIRVIYRRTRGRRTSTSQQLHSSTGIPDAEENGFNERISMNRIQWNRTYRRWMHALRTSNWEGLELSRWISGWCTEWHSILKPNFPLSCNWFASESSIRLGLSALSTVSATLTKFVRVVQIVFGLGSCLTKELSKHLNGPK